MFGKLGYQSFKAAENGIDTMNKIIENISNAKSIGYKKGQATFVETLNGEITRYESRDFSQGPLRKTGDLFDLALDGPGFFEVEMPNGQRAYTRAGRFGLTSEGELVTDEGYRVIPEVEPIGKPIVEVNNLENSGVGMNIKVTTPKVLIPAELIPEVQEDGTVNGINPNTGEKTKIAKVNVVIFNNTQGLESIGRSYYLPTVSSGLAQDMEVGPDSSSKVKQGYLEFANVDVIAEFVNLTQMRNLITAQLKLLKLLDKIHENINFTASRSV